nr:MAG TPA: hypothetical protein [Caudoviricetes sp.]
MKNLFLFQIGIYRIFSRNRLFLKFRICSIRLCNR